MLLISAVVCGAAGLIINKAAGNPSKLSKHTVLEIGGLVLVLWAIAVVLLLFAISRFNRAARAQREQRESAVARQVAGEHLARARRLTEQLAAGKLPVVEQVWDVVLGPSERVLLDGTAGYSRYYGFGSPAGHTPSSARAPGEVGSGERAQQGAASAAAARWRDHQQCRMVVTDKRLLCQIQAQGWTSFGHDAATAIQASPDNRSVVLEVRDAPPIRLSGPLTTEILVALVWALYGVDGLREHPALAEVRPLLPAAPVPEVTVEQPPIGDGQVSDARRVGLLEFVATRELTLAEHAALLLGVSEPEAAEQLDELVEEGLVSRVRLSVYAPTAYRATQLGADRVDTALPPQRPLDLAGYRDAVAVNDVSATARSAAKPSGSTG